MGQLGEDAQLAALGTSPGQLQETALAQSELVSQHVAVFLCLHHVRTPFFCLGLGHVHYLVLYR